MSISLVVALEKTMAEIFKPSYLFQWKFGKFRANTIVKDAPVISL